MADWKRHVKVGFLCTLVFLIVCYFTTIYNTFDYKFVLACIVVSFIYSQLPDVDTQASKIRWILTTAGAGWAFVNLISGRYSTAIIFLGLVIIIWVVGLIKGFGHRGVSHTFIAACILSSLMFYYSYWLVIVAFINYMSHLIVDRE